MIAVVLWTLVLYQLCYTKMKWLLNNKTLAFREGFISQL